MSDLEIPESWAAEKIERVFDLNPRNTGVSDSTDVTFVRMSAVDADKASIVLPEVRRWKDVKKGFTHFKENDIIFAKITPCMENKKSAVARNLLNHIGAGSTEFHVFRPPCGILPHFALHYIRSDSFLREAEANMTGSAGQKRVPTRWLSEQQFPIPPRGEQQRIVAKIESCFAKIDATEKSLDEAESLLKKYRESLLAKAFRGELVPQDPKDEPASALLKRIRADKDKQSDGKRRAQDELPPISEKDIPFEIPKSWQWIRISDAGEVKLGRQRAPQHHHGKHMRKYLRVANVFEERIDTAEVYEMNFDPKEFEIFQLKYGDVLLNEGQSIELVGRPAMFKDELPDVCFTNTIVRFRASAAVDAEYALIVFLGYFKNGRFRKIAKAGTNIAHLGADRFGQLEFPVPPLNEQKRIVATIRRSLSRLTDIANAISVGRTRASRMRASILSSAFSGRLVGQIQEEGTGHELLEQIIKSKSTEVEAEQKSLRSPKTTPKGKKKNDLQRTTV